MTATAIAERYPVLASSEHFASFLARRLNEASAALQEAVGIDAIGPACDELVALRRTLHEMGLYDKVAFRADCMRAYTHPQIAAPEANTPGLPPTGPVPSGAVPECARCEEPITGEPVTDANDRFWLPADQRRTFCSDACLLAYAESQVA